LQKKILITAGPTREMLDPIRFLSNLSTGEMGYMLARVAQSRGYRVTLISGPTSLQPPRGVRFVSVTSAAEMKKACEKYFSTHLILVMTAAVCDFTAKLKKNQKIRRVQTKQIHLKRTADIVAGLARKKGKRIVIGFCLETQDWLNAAKRKLKRKNLDGIVANYYVKGHNPFGPGRLTTALIDQGGQKVRMQRSLTKRQLSGRILRWIEGYQD